MKEKENENNQRAGESNAEYLERIQYKGEIQKDLLCAHSKVIMTDPMRIVCVSFAIHYSPKVVDRRFLSKRAARTDGVGIVSMETVKAKIDAFMERVRAEQSTAPGPAFSS